MKKLLLILTAAVFTAVMAFAAAETAAVTPVPTKQAKAWKARKRPAKQQAAYPELTPGTTRHTKATPAPNPTPKAAKK